MDILAVVCFCPAVMPRLMSGSDASDVVRRSVSLPPAAPVVSRVPPSPPPSATPECQSKVSAGDAVLFTSVVHLLEWFETFLKWWPCSDAAWVNGTL